MGNARVAQRRAGVKKKGPLQGLGDYNAMKEGLKEGEAERQPKCRELQREREREARLLATSEEEPGEGNDLSSCELLCVVFESVIFFMSEMQGCRDSKSRLVIMELFLENGCVSPFLLEYYPCVEDAKV
ncbi:hypothetical protein KC19_VG150200 [Ceratodon purpureus]|uniref:Uncharacterized protein n=1 Tax=Ceratodon purpureus TaxID=3225 RepID=A0A8T0HQC4_CERPU|nr:hypothetical protein KC19_VG150200 [Ceratodon purpureus]